MGSQHNELTVIETAIQLQLKMEAGIEPPAQFIGRLSVNSSINTDELQHIALEGCTIHIYPPNYTIV